MAYNRVTAPGLCALGIVLNLIASSPAAAGAPTPPAPGPGGATAPTFSGPGGSSHQFQPQQSPPHTEAPRPAPNASQHQAPDNGPRGGFTDRGPAPALRFGNFGQGHFVPGVRPNGFDGRQGAWNAARPGFGYGFGFGPSIGRGFGPAGLFSGWAFSGGLFGPRAMMPVMAYRGWGFGGGLPIPSRGPVRPAQWGWANQNFPAYPQQGSEHRPTPYQGWARNAVVGQ